MKLPLLKFMLASLCWLPRIDVVLAEQKPAVLAEQIPSIIVSQCTVSLIDQVTLAAPLPGILGKVECEEGDQIAADQLVAQLKNDEVRASYQLAEIAAQSDIAYRLAAKTQAVAEVELQQAESLNERQQVYTEFEMRRLKLTLDQTELECEKAIHEQELKDLEKKVTAERLHAHDVKATFAGTVVRVFKKRGEAVQQGEPLVEVVNASRLRIEGFVPLAQVRVLKIGQTIKVNVHQESTVPVTADAKQVYGKLKFIDVSVQPVTQEVRIWAEVDNQSYQLKPGQLVDMQISLDRVLTSLP